MEGKTIEELIKEEKNFIKEASELLTNETDKEYFTRKKGIFRTAATLAETPEQKELLLNNLVQARHQLVFLLFRREIITDEITKKFLSMMTIEDANKRYADVEDERKKRQEEESVRINALREEENKLDIFKGVLSGMTKEKAEEELKKYQAEAAKAMGV